MIDGFDERGRFAKGNKFGKLSGPPRNGVTRNALTMKLLERFAARNQDGISIEELLFDIAQNDSESSEMRFKAAAKLADLVFPKTAQVEIEIEEDSKTSLKDIDERINALLGKATEWEEVDSDDKS